MSVVARPTRVSVDVGRVRVPVLLMVEIAGEIRVLFVSVSVVALPTSVSVAAGSVSAPDATADALTLVLPDVPPKNRMDFPGCDI